MKLSTLITRGKALASHPKTRRFATAALLLVMSAAMAHANTGADTMAAKLSDSVMPYVRLGLRLFGGMIAIGGFVVGFNGFTGREEGFDKVFKIGVGFVGIALGIVCITNTADIISWLNIAGAFNAQ